MTPLGCVIVPGEAALARDCGFDYVELSGKGIAAMNEQEFAALIRELTAAGIPCRGVNAYCPAQVVIAGEGYDLDAAREYAIKLRPRLQALGVRLVGIGSPLSRRLPEGFDRALAVAQAVGFYRAVGEIMAPAGIRVCVEALANCYCNFINTTDEAFALCDAVGLSNVGVVIDFYNMEHMNEADRPIPRSEKLFHAHISDDDGSPQRRSFLKPEKAETHIRRVRGLLHAGYRGGITLEIDLPVERHRAVESLNLLRQAI